MSDDDLRQLSCDLAYQRPGRTAEGAIVDEARALRKIEVGEKPGEQVIFVYDDPAPGRPLHAVVRGSLALDRSEQDFVRDEIRNVFCRIVAPIPDR